MVLDWFNARQATEVGTSLADDFVLQSASGAPRRKGAKSGTHENELQSFLQKFLQRVDRDARPLQLNVFKRAKLANSFKWRLLEKGVERAIVEELTQALVLRLTTKSGPSTGMDRPIRIKGPRRSADRIQALLSQGNEHLSRGAYEEAATCYGELLTLEPRHVVARNNCGAALWRLGRYKEAEEQFRRAIGIKRSYPEPLSNLGTILSLFGRYEEAETFLRRALRLKPSYTDALLNLGLTLFLLSRMAEARDCLEKALRLAPRHAQALVGLGLVAAHEGALAEAEAHFKHALEIDPGAADAWAGIASLRTMTAADGAWLKRAKEIATSGLTPSDEAKLRFAMGKYCDDIRDFAQAFGHYQRANELQKLAAIPYDRSARTGFVDDMIRVYTRDSLSRADRGASDSAVPVFVIGMPRSGTSLVEQIIASHPAARGAGELQFWGAAVHRHEQALRRETPAEALKNKLASAYLRVLTAQSPDILRMVDKMPANSDHLGVIHLTFPNARFIYLQRDPIDTCLSCYFQQFSAALSFTMDLSDLAHYWQQHHRLMKHWREVLPAGTLLTVPYAELAADQEKWSRAIIEFVGLPWDARCLDFYRTERTVTTASFWQVRQPIFHSSVGRWRNYEKFIGPLLSLRDT